MGNISLLIEIIFCAMSLFDLLLRFAPGTHNPALDTARKNHDNLPESKFFEDSLSKDESEKDRETTFQRGIKLGQIFAAIVQEHYSSVEQERVLNNILKALTYLFDKHRIFPDMDYENILYTDYYDLIQIAKDMSLGDDALPHWPEEPNHNNRYLELTTSELTQIFMSFSEEALLDEFQFGAREDKWIKYLLRETLKTRQRFERERQKQDEALRFSPEICKVIEQEKTIRE